MVVVFVRLCETATAKPTQTVYGLLLPSAGDSRWNELDVRDSNINASGLFPSTRAAALWANAGTTPLLLPYYGHETVVHSKTAHDCLVSVLKGNFEEIMLSDLKSRTMLSNLHAVKMKTDNLPASAPVLQISCATVGHSYYVLASDVRELLNLDEHALSRLHKVRDGATHCASVYRVGEGHVIINAHPTFHEPVAVAGWVNEPLRDERCNMQMITARAVCAGRTALLDMTLLSERSVAPSMLWTVADAKMVDKNDPVLKARGLLQTRNALDAWAEHVSVHSAGNVFQISEKMVLYKTKCKMYTAKTELTVDYGNSYVRDYDSGEHRQRAGKRPVDVDASERASHSKSQFLCSLNQH